MNVLIWIVNISSSFGEITNAYQFATELAGDDINVFFYKSSPFVQNYLYLNDKKIIYLDKNEITHYKFDIVIFSEYLYLFRSKIKYLKEEIAFIEANFFNKVMIGTIDSYQLSGYIKEENNQLVFDLPDSHEFENVKFPDKNYFFAINPCPTGYPEIGKTNVFLEYYWVRPKLISNEEFDEKIRQNFLIDKESKQIFLPLSKWQHLFWGGKIESVKEFTIKLADFFTGFFDSLALDIPYSFFFGVPSPEFKKFNNKNFASYFFNPDAKSYIPPAYYDQFLARTDLILTLHIIQNSFIRSVLSGITGINLTHNVNPLKVSHKQGFFLNNIRLDSSGTIGFNKAKIEQNPYYNLFKTFEVFDPALRDYIKETLVNGKTCQEKVNFEKYQSGLNNCLKAGEILNDIILKSINH
jgi:hypothetical protein